jgi:hypothetical protein
MTVYEMTLGRHAYTEISNPLILCEMIRSDTPPSLNGIPGVSSEIVDFVAKWYLSPYSYHSLM